LTGVLNKNITAKNKLKQNKKTFSIWYLVFSIWQIIIVMAIFKLWCKKIFIKLFSNNIIYFKNFGDKVVNCAKLDFWITSYILNTKY